MYTFVFDCYLPFAICFCNLLIFIHSSSLYLLLLPAGLSNSKGDFSGRRFVMTTAGQQNVFLLPLIIRHAKPSVSHPVRGMARGVSPERGGGLFWDWGGTGAPLVRCSDTFLHGQRACHRQHDMRWAARSSGGLCLMVD